jgi:hypothetical protein
VAVALVAGPALIYELLRRNKGERFDFRHPTREAFFIWVFVGVGYAVRGTFGLYFGVQELGPLPIFFLWALTLWAFGTMVVTLTWALEATAYCHRLGERWEYIPYLEDKYHLAVLLKFLDIRPRPGPPVAKPNGADEQVLVPRHHTVAPWNLSLWVAACGAGVLGIALSHHLELPIAPTLVSAALGLGLALLLTSCSRTWQRWLLTVAGAGLFVGFALWLEAPVAYVAGIPWLLCSGFYSFFRQVSYADLKAGLAPILHTGQHMATVLARIAVGSSTWEVLTHTKHSREALSRDRQS